MNNLSQTIDIGRSRPGAARFWQFMGPAAMVSVGYMDPGNWATDLGGGARFGYQLLWVLVASNLIALLLQSLSARLGVVTGRDLAQSCRDGYSKPVSIALWLLCEVAIVACNLAEVLGGAIALKLLFGLPLALGALLTGLDVMLIIALQHYGIRKLEAMVAAMVLTVGLCMGLNVVLARPEWSAVAAGLVPHLNAESLYVALGILGATVMPHNLYLHSSLVQTRRIEPSDAGRSEAIRYNFFDTALALNIAFFINAAILVVSAATFWTRGIEVTELHQAHALLSPLLGSAAASVAFAIALLAAGQSSSVTGTLAGQVVMEGFVRMRMSPVKRRLLSRGLAIVPAVTVLSLSGDDGILSLLVLSQVVLSLQLPFAMVPLVRFTNDARRMGRFVSPLWVQALAFGIACVITGLNVWLIGQALGVGDGSARAWWHWPAAGFGLACALLLAWVAWVPLRPAPVAEENA